MRITLFLILSVTNTLIVADVMTFKQGANGYTAGKSVDLSDMYGLGEPGQWNDNGATFGDGENEWCIGLLKEKQGWGYDINPLLRFDDLDQLMPAGSTVLKATLTLHIFAAAPGAKLIGRYLNVDWYAGDTMAGGTGICGWRYRKEGVEWSGYGATGDGTDLIADLSFVMPSEGTVSEISGPVSVDLDPEIVQMWIDDPSKNNGFKLQTDIPNVHISIVQMQHVAYQGTKTPELTLEYTTGPAPPRAATPKSSTPTGTSTPSTSSSPQNANSPSSSVGSDASKLIGSGLVFVAGVLALF